jgi:hypothetical protein
MEVCQFQVILTTFANVWEIFQMYSFSVAIMGLANSYYTFESKLS